MGPIAYTQPTATVLDSDLSVSLRSSPSTPVAAMHSPSTHGNGNMPLGLRQAVQPSHTNARNGPPGTRPNDPGARVSSGDTCVDR